MMWEQIIIALLAASVSYAFARFIAKSFLEGVQYEIRPKPGVYPTPWREAYKCEGCSNIWSERDFMLHTVCPACGENMLDCDLIAWREALSNEGKVVREEKKS